jgi:putative heme iron utilization protein
MTQDRRGEHQRPSAPSAADPAAEAARAPTHAERTRTLVHAARSATLCTLTREPAGHPYGSLVAFASDAQGRPLLLLSTLAEHTQNLAVCADASVLVAEPWGLHGSPLAIGRVTILGPCAALPEGAARDEARAAFLAAHPDAAGYADFRDFAFYRLTPTSLRYVGGFGRMSWVTADAYAAAEPDPLARAASGILTHMNGDHADAVLAYARVLAKVPDASAATMTAVDRYGFELAVTTPAGPRATRLAFDAPVDTADAVRKAMVDLVKRARAAS